ncbi:MAG: polyribonucleotide nucleotidyltransferase [Elusimicrobia bacterium]|nr:polyribonucleotide nucleotidyltransferase [Elusimicrobiota bacterium]
MTEPKLIRLEEKVGNKAISFETGLLAKQAGGSVMARCGETVVLASCVQAKKPRDNPPSFVPLSVDYKERTYAAGKIPGGFFKREGRPREKEILGSRLSDRTLRPLFPEYFNTETQVVSLVMSSDGENDSDVLAINAAAAALMVSDIPFNGPVAAVRINKAGGQFVVNPTYEQRQDSDLELIISGTPQGILMVEGGGREIPNDDLIAAMETAKREIDKLCALQIKLREACGKPKTAVKVPEIKPEIRAAVEAIAKPAVEKLLSSFPPKEVLERTITEIQDGLIAEMTVKFPETAAASFQVMALMEEIIYGIARSQILEKRARADGRKTDEIRAIAMQAGFLPRTHGSALFTRGQTQTMATVTLGTPEDKQILDDLEGRSLDKFMLHYNFPGYSTGEVRPDRGPGRREIGHGSLAKRALLHLLPSDDLFPYTIRIVSDILESNGSSSMATVCGGSIALFDAGVPMKAACAGIAMGLITDGDCYAVLSDISGFEDHFGDMDFKLAGTAQGITAFQMDVKLASGIPINILKEAIAQAAGGRNHILGLMTAHLSAPRADISKYAPGIAKLMIAKDKIGQFIGPGGKNIRGIIERTGADIQVEDDGSIFIACTDRVKLEAAKTMVEYYTMEVEVGKVYTGRVVSIKDFGAFVEILPGKEGLLHISEIALQRVQRVEDVLKMGEEIEVKVVDMDNAGKIRLSRRVLLAPEKR